MSFAVPYDIPTYLLFTTARGHQIIPFPQGGLVRIKVAHYKAIYPQDSKLLKYSSKIIFSFHSFATECQNIDTGLISLLTKVITHENILPNS